MDNRIRREIIPGVFLTYIPSERFKTCYMSISLLRPLEKDAAARNNLLPRVLDRGTAQLPDMERIAARLDDLYGARLVPVVRKKGEVQCVGFASTFIDDRFVDDKELLEKVTELIGQMLLAPATVGGRFINEYVESEREKLIEDIRSVAEKHGLVCLLHEKPFAGVNGSGKHNNWSLSTDTGEGLLKPGKKPEKNVRFLLFLAAVIKAVDEYQDLLRISVATAGNDHRLGASEAPPAVLSVFLGDELGAILEAIENEHEYERPERRLMDIGAAVLPHLPMDTTDRNRTSPMAFTGNKFEFRMPGSSQGIAACNTVINAAVAEALCQFADELEGAEDFNTALQKLIFETIKKHKRIIFNGNGYDEAWLREAETRGLSNLKSTPEALVHYTDEKNVALMEKHHILTQVELESRQEIMQENYCKVLNIEALTMLDMAKKQIVPGAADYTRSLAESIKIKKELGLPCEAEENLAKIMCARLDETARCVGALEKAVSGAKNNTSPREGSFYYHDSVLTAMDALRTAADSMEENMSEEYLRYPTYKDILFNI